MDIKQKIQELSLDQKAKLYFMGLVRQGKIDTLPDDPKAAYVSMMMNKDDYGRSISGKDKRTFMEPEDMTMAARARKMAGMEENKKPNLDSMDDVDNSNWSPDRGGGSIGYMEWEDGTEMTPQEIQDYFEVNHDLYDDIMQGLYETNDPEDDEEQAEYDKGWYGESLKEIAAGLGYLNEEENYQNLPTPDKINLSYTDPGFRFYGMYLYKDGNRFAKISYEDRATKYLKNLGVKTEIPRRFDTDILDKIEQEIEALGIKGDYDAAMDVS